VYDFCAISVDLLHMPCNLVHLYVLNTDLLNIDMYLFAAGLFLGAVTGGLIGLATESGLFRGTGIGAITGALVSIEVVDSSIRLWRSRRSGIWSILYVVSTLNSMLGPWMVGSK
jgi:hypothetical protein